MHRSVIGMTSFHMTEMHRWIAVVGFILRCSYGAGLKLTGYCLNVSFLLRGSKRFQWSRPLNGWCSLQEFKGLCFILECCFHACYHLQEYCTLQIFGKTQNVPSSLKRKRSRMPLLHRYIHSIPLAPVMQVTVWVPGDRRLLLLSCAI